VEGVRIVFVRGEPLESGVGRGAGPAAGGLGEEAGEMAEALAVLKLLHGGGAIHFSPCGEKGGPLV